MAGGLSLTSALEKLESLHLLQKLVVRSILGIPLVACGIIAPCMQTLWRLLVQSLPHSQTWPDATLDRIPAHLKLMCAHMQGSVFGLQLQLARLKSLTSEQAGCHVL